MLASCLFLFVGDFSLELKTLLLQAAVARDRDVAVLGWGALTSVCSSPESHGQGRDPHPSGGERPGARALGKWLPFSTGCTFLLLQVGREVGLESRVGRVQKDPIVDFQEGSKFLFLQPAKPRSL